jgi:transcriptional regulator with XRE-family HTH domain
MNAHDQIRDLRIKRNITLKELSERCGISATNLSRIERGLENPSLKRVYKILHVLKARIIIK